MHRDNDEKYIGCIKPASGGGTGDIDIWNATTGVACTVNYGSGAQAYLTGARENYDILTVQDTTIVTNRTTQVGVTAAPSFTANTQATIKLVSEVSNVPYELKVNRATLSTMSFMIGKLSRKISIPFGVNVLWDPMSTIALAVSTNAQFVREIFTGTYASDMGIWNPNAGEAMRYRNSLGRKDIQMFYNISAEFAYSLDRRTTAERAESTVFSSIPDAVLVSGQITGQSAKLTEIKEVSKIIPTTPVLANTGVNLENVEEILKVTDGVIIGSSLKVNGDTWKNIDFNRAKKFMTKVKSIRKNA